MVTIRLKQTGTKSRKQWRVVVADSRSPRDGRFIEEIGHYDPLPADEKIFFKQDRLDYWLKEGARLSPTVDSLIKRLKRKSKAAAA
ncbi:MAG: 30S ribosomal protein S16 [Candidatus Omnitrophota bacterium]|nr:30S ribosomal protein S16 [Candidatus Omnitrophota bacterium]